MHLTPRCLNQDARHLEIPGASTPLSLAAAKNFLAAAKNEFFISDGEPSFTQAA